MTKERASAGPANSLAALPVSTKRPPPMVTPTPKTMRSRAPRFFFSRCSGSSVSRIDCSTDLVRVSWPFMAPPVQGSTGGYPPAAVLTAWTAWTGCVRTRQPGWMARTIYYTATTLDGYLADDNNSLDWLFVQDHDDSGPLGYPAFIREVGAIAMGATTYQWLLDHPDAVLEQWPYPQPCWVFTHRDLPPAADNVTVTQAPVAQVHADMVEAAG